MRELLKISSLQDLLRRWLNADDGFSVAPRFDVREDTDCFVLRADIPGLEELDVDISLTPQSPEHQQASRRRETPAESGRLCQQRREEAGDRTASIRRSRRRWIVPCIRLLLHG